MATAASEAQTVCLGEAELLEQVEVVAAVVERLPLHIDAFDDRDELVSSIAVPARARSTRSLAAATTVPQSGVAATVIPRPRRKSSRQLPILRNQPGVSLRRRRCSLRQRPE